MRPTVMLYHLENQTGAKLRLLAIRQKLRVRPVRQEEYLEPLGALAGISEATGLSYVGSGFSEEMLLFCGLTSRQLDAFLQAMRREKLPPIALKAVLTETNLSWDSIRLHDALLEEHAAMQQGRNAHEGS